MLVGKFGIHYAQADIDSASLMLFNFDLNMTLDPDNISNC